MNDVELTDREAERLRDLLQRSAAEVPAELPAWSPSLSPTRRSRDDAIVPLERRRRRRWWIPAIGVAAVAALVVAGVRVASDDDSEVVATPDEGAIELPGDGIWRLPPDDGRFTVVDLTRTGAEQWSWIAVDDPADPRRWMTVLAPGLPMLAPVFPVLAEEQMPDGSVARRYGPPEGSASGTTWVVLTGPAVSAPGRVDTPRYQVTVAYGGLSDPDAMVVVRRLAADIAASPDPSPMAPILALAPPPGLTTVPPPGGPSSASSSAGIGYSVRIGDHDDPTSPVVNVAAVQYEGPPIVTALNWKVSAETQLFFDRSGISRVTDRPELGPGAFSVGGSDVAGIYLVDDDGVALAVVSQDVMGNSPRPRAATMDELVELARSLRAMSEDEFRRELERRGVEGVDGDVGPTTTTIAPPAGD